GGRLHVRLHVTAGAERCCVEPLSVRLRSGALGLVVALVALVVAGPAGATGSGDFTGDIMPPQIVSYSISPASVDVTNGDATFTVTVHATDDLSGVDSANAWWANTSNPPMNFGSYLARTTGDGNDGTYSGTIEIPRYSPAGDYPMAVGLRDRVGNETSANEAPLHVVDTNPDNTPPRLTSLHFTPTSVDVRS